TRCRPMAARPYFEGTMVDFLTWRGGRSRRAGDGPTAHRAPCCNTFRPEALHGVAQGSGAGRRRRADGGLFDPPPARAGPRRRGGTERKGGGGEDRGGGTVRRRPLRPAHARDDRNGRP